MKILPKANYSQLKFEPKFDLVHQGSREQIWTHGQSEICPEKPQSFIGHTSISNLQETTPRIVAL